MLKINSLDNNYLKHLVRLRENKKHRQESGTILLMGKKIVGEICSLCKAKAVLSCGEYGTGKFSSEKHYNITESVLKKITGLSSPEDIVAEFSMPDLPCPDIISHLLVLDSISDPGNLGTLMRTALALGWDAIYLLDGGVDPYNDKTLRAAKGSHFKLPILEGGSEDLKELVDKHDIQLLVADMKGEAISNISLDKGCALVLGNESHGPSDFIKREGLAVTIPISNKMESLNVAVAGAILLYTLGDYCER